MVISGLSKPDRGDRKGKRAGRRAVGPTLYERDGYWHAYGTVRAGRRSSRIRKSLGLAVEHVTQAEAETALDAYVADLKAKITGAVGRGDPVSIAALGYLSSPRKRPLAPTAVAIVQEINVKFGPRRLNDIAEAEWHRHVDGEPTATPARPGRMTGRAASTRERYLGGLFGFLNFAKRKHGLAALPSFERDNAARNPNRRVRRRISELRPDIVQTLFDCAHISIRAQLAVERCTGARVSSVIYAARLCDLVLGRHGSHITFPKTKNGEDVTAALDATAIGVLKEYLKWRGKLHDREAPLFLTWRRKPYKFNGRRGGGQNKTGFNAAKRRAGERITALAEIEAGRLRKLGQRKAAASVIASAEADAGLIAKVTQHWFRHRLATIMLRKDPRAAMDQGGWLDLRSLMGYAHDVPEHRQAIVEAADDFVTLASRGTPTKRTKR